MNEDDLPYLQRGRQKLETPSSLLISSSKYLNDYRIREWVTNQCLKRNGRDCPNTYGIPSLIEAVREVQDHERIEALFNDARKDWPEFDKWLDDRWLARLTREDMKSCPEGSVGGIWYKQLVGAGMQVDIIPTPMPDNRALNNEDSVIIADEALGSELEMLYPEVHARITARRAFLRDQLGVDLKPTILPTSNSPLCLPPFWLASDKLLTLE